MQSLAITIFNGMFPIPPDATGILSVVVALLSEKAEVQYDPEKTTPDNIAQEIKGLGFGAEVLESSDGVEEGKVDLLVS